MDFSFIPYIIPYLLLFLLWMLAAHRQILFWLYLWQLKEYHWGRFITHFETAKGKSIFINPLFLVKVSLLIASAGFYVWFGRAHAIPLSAPVLFTAWIPFVWTEFVFLAAVMVLFGFEALRTAWGLFRANLLHPTVTRKSLMLLVASHGVVFAGAIAVFLVFLGESSELDFALAAFVLLGIDILLSAIIGAIVLALQPLTLWQKSKILKRATDKIAARSDLLTIGITGSYGKSVTKELVALVLSQEFKVLKTEANQNTEMGVAETIIGKLKPEHQVFVCEMGAVHKGKIRQTADIVKPKIGVLTGINQQHLGVFGSQENIVEAKFELLEALPPEGTAIINWQSDIIQKFHESQRKRVKAKNQIFCGRDISVGNINASANGLIFDIAWQGRKATLATNARGAFMVEPIMLAAAAGLAAGMEFEMIVEIINKTDFTPFNLKVVKNAAGMNVIDSTYSSNPDGVFGHLDYLKLWPGKKAIVMPCLIELGAESKRIHFEIGQKIAKACDLAVVTTKDRFAEIKKGAVSAGTNPENIIFSDDPKIIGELLKNRLSAGDVVLLEGRSGKNLVEQIKK